MKGFHIKSILMGIGIGTILTSIVSIIYLAGYDPSKHLSREDILELAIKYNYVQTNQVPVFASDTPIPAEQPVVREMPESTPEPTAKSTPKLTPVALPEPTPAQARDVILTVNKGDTSKVVAERLKSMSLIEDVEAFKEKLGQMGLSSNIQIGSFEISGGSSIEQIIKIITDRQ